MKSAVSTVIVVIQVVGACAVASGLGYLGSEFISDARAAAAQANLRQIETALELYHFFHQEYPDVEGGQALISVLLENDYIRRATIDGSSYNYARSGGGQEYSLSYNGNETPHPLEEKIEELEGQHSYPPYH